MGKVLEVPHPQINQILFNRTVPKNIFVFNMSQIIESDKLPILKLWLLKDHKKDWLCAPEK